MKKIFLVLLTFIMSAISAHAANWQPIDTNIPNFTLYMDKDSVKWLNGNDCVYAIKYRSGNEPLKIAYIKSSLFDNYIGIIQAGTYEEENYRPTAVLSDPHVFMKPLKEESFLVYAHRYAMGMSRQTETLAFGDGAEEKEVNIKSISYKAKTPVLQSETVPENLKDYVEQVSAELNKNWNPPKSARNTQAIVIINMGADGSLNNYKFAKSSGDDLNDRSVISAIEQTVPFPKFPVNGKNQKSFNFQFVFDYGKIFKSVR